LLVAIRSGAFPHQAAEAFGITRARFEAWLAKGRRKQAPARYRRFAEDVRQAIAKARLRAEMQVLTKDPKFWLKHGPGKETPNSPGWSNPAKPATVQDGATLRDAEMSRLLSKVLKVLNGFPEAHQAVLRALQGFAVRKKREKGITG
jgi:hypothetical protein